MFDVLVKIVSFDLFPIHQYFDFDFTNTEAWSNSFAWLDYDSLNFVENMGSASIIFATNILIALISVIVLSVEKLFKFKCRCRDRSKNERAEQQEIDKKEKE